MTTTKEQAAETRRKVEAVWALHKSQGHITYRQCREIIGTTESAGQWAKRTKRQGYDLPRLVTDNERKAMRQADDLWQIADGGDLKKWQVRYYFKAGGRTLETALKKFERYGIDIPAIIDTGSRCRFEAAPELRNANAISSDAPEPRQEPVAKVNRLVKSEPLHSRGLQAIPETERYLPDGRVVYLIR